MNHDYNDSHSAGALRVSLLLGPHSKGQVRSLTTKEETSPDLLHTTPLSLYKQVVSLRPEAALQAQIVCTWNGTIPLV